MLKRTSSFFKKTIPSALGMAVIALVTTFFVNAIVALAFSAPTGAPSVNTNVSAPINVGGASQIKSGALWVGSLGTDGGASFVGDKVTVTTGGQVKITGGSPALGKILTSDASGLATWQASPASPWTISGNNIYNNNTGNVGIGTMSPDANYKLSTSGGGVKAETNSASQPALYASNAGGGAAIVVGTGGLTLGGVNKVAWPSAIAETDPIVKAITGLVKSNGTTISVAVAGMDYLKTETDPKVGTLTTSYVPRWNGTALANGNIFDNGTYVGIGMASPGAKLDVAGNINISAGSSYNLYGYSAIIGYPQNGSYYFGGSGNLTTTAYYNTAVGSGALANNTTGGYNTANGVDSLMSNTIGNFNVANGIYALYSNKTGQSNVAIGEATLMYNINGSYNTAIGEGALYLNKNSYNTATGAYALQNNTTGYYNTANGMYSLQNNTTSYNNTANGFGALRFNSSGNNNTATGAAALMYNTTGYENTANGIYALYSNTIGYYNTANGVYSLRLNTTGSYNTANGYSALYSNTTGNYNVADGQAALYLNTTGRNNVAVGHNALYYNKTGSDNTAIGDNTTMSTNGGLSNTIAIGTNAFINTSNKAVIGNSGIQTIGGYGAWVNYSDIRLKENIYYKNDLGLSFIKDLKTASFNYKADLNKVRRDGLIAQDVQATLNKLGVKFSGLVVDDDAMGTLNLSYDMFTIPLINSVKELKAENDMLKSENNGLRVRLDNLEAKVNQLMAK